MCSRVGVFGLPFDFIWQINRKGHVAKNHRDGQIGPRPKKELISAKNPQWFLKIEFHVLFGLSW